jgi:hypothetical protein
MALKEAMQEHGQVLKLEFEKIRHVKAYEIVWEM